MTTENAYQTSEEMEPTVEQELTILARRFPHFAKVLEEAALFGRMSGYSPMTTIIWPAGTISVHLAHGNAIRSLALVEEICQELHSSPLRLTPLQKLLWAVRAGDKPATSEPLKRFVDLLQPYLPTSEMKAIQATQLFLWEKHSEDYRTNTSDKQERSV